MRSGREQDLGARPCHPWSGARVFLRNCLQSPSAHGEPLSPSVSRRASLKNARVSGHRARYRVEPRDRTSRPSPSPHPRLRSGSPLKHGTASVTARLRDQSPSALASLRFRAGALLKLLGPRSELPPHLFLGLGRGRVEAPPDRTDRDAVSSPAGAPLKSQDRRLPPTRHPAHPRLEPGLR